MNRLIDPSCRLILLLGLLLALAACEESPATPTAQGPALTPVTVRPAQPTPTPAPTTTPDRVLVTATPDLGVCPEAEVAAILRDMPSYHPGSRAPAVLDQDGFTIDGEPFIVRGIDYYPALRPWQRFPYTDLNTIEADFARLQEVHVNTVRLFLWYRAYFVCPGSGAVPNQSAFLWLDSVLRLADAFDLRLILVLHDQPDLTIQPLYTGAGYSLAQTAFIVNRYRSEPNLLAWDLRDAGDADYTPFSDEPAPFSRAAVLDWLARTAAAVRQLDPSHPITAGWDSDAEATIPLVDIVSFQHYGDESGLRERIAALRSYTNKPVLLIALGISSFDTSEPDQAQRLRTTVRTAESDGVIGWLVWTMYDYPVTVTCFPDPCASLDDARHHYGLWRADGSRKPAANALETLAGS